MNKKQFIGCFFSVTVLFLSGSSGGMHTQYRSVWKGDSPQPSHNFYIQHYITVATVVIYTWDAHAFHALVADMAESAFDKPSLHFLTALFVSIEFQSPGRDRAEMTETTSGSAPSKVYDIIKAFPAISTEHSGIWKDEPQTFTIPLTSA